MQIRKTKAPYSSMEDKQYKLCYSDEKFSKFRTKTDEIEEGIMNLDKNISMTNKKGKIVFKYINAVCPYCYSKKVNKIGFASRKLIFLRKGKQECRIQRYECKKCGKTFSTNLNSIVGDNKNITLPVISEILKLYSIHGSSIYKIQFHLKELLYVDISYQSIENVLKDNEILNNPKPWSYSGHYLFDSLWVKINGHWKYLLALFDLKLNKIVSFNLVYSETEQEIKKFLEESTRNQHTKSITTDLKIEYRRPIRKLGFKHQFCKFHTKQKINKNIYDYIKTNEPDNNEKELIKKYKELIFSILDSNDYNIACKIRDTLITNIKNAPKPIFKLLNKFIIPYFKNLTNTFRNKKISSTSNKIENAFQKIFPKHIKKRMKTIYGVLNRFNLKSCFWDVNNAFHR